MGEINTKVQLKTCDFLKINMNTSEFFNDQLCQGNLLITCDNPFLIKSFSITIEKRQKWHYIEQVYNKDREQYDEIDHFDKETKTIHPFQINVAIGSILNPGNWNIPFTFPLNGLTPSFEFEDGKTYCYNRYIIIAKFLGNVNGEDKIGEVEEFIFIKSRPLPLNTPIISENSKKVKKWGLFGKGETELKVNIPKNNFQFYEEIPLKVEIQNKKGKMNINSIKFDIKKMIIFKTKTKKEFEKRMFKIDENIKVKKGENQNIDIVLKLNEDKSKTIGEKKFDSNILQPSFEDSLIKCHYYIKATAYFESLTNQGSRPRCVLDIVYGHENINLGFNYSLCFDPNMQNINLQNYQFIPQQGIQPNPNQQIAIQPQIPQQQQQPVPQYTNQQPIPPYINQQPVPQYINQQPIPQYINQQPIPQYINQQPIPQYENQQPIPQYVNQQQVPQYVNQQQVPQYVNQQPIPQYENQQPVPQYTNQQPTPQYTNQQSTPQYTNQQSTPQYTNQQPDKQYTNLPPPNTAENPNEQQNNQQNNNENNPIEYPKFI